MKTAIDKNESEIEKMKRESLEWLERYGKTAPSVISVAINAFSQPKEQVTDEEIEKEAEWAIARQSQSDRELLVKFCEYMNWTGKYTILINCFLNSLTEKQK